MLVGQAVLVAVWAGAFASLCCSAGIRVHGDVGERGVVDVCAAVKVHFDVDGDADVEGVVGAVDVEVCEADLDDLGDDGGLGAFERLLVVVVGGAQAEGLGPLALASELVGGAGGQLGDAVGRERGEGVAFVAVFVVDGDAWGVVRAALWEVGQLDHAS